MSEYNTNEMEQTTVTTQEDFANALDELTTANEDEESEGFEFNLWETGKNVQAARQTAKDIYHFCTWLKAKADTRIERAEERKQKREEAKQKIKLKNPFSKKQTEETPESTEGKSVEETKSPFDGLTIEQIAAIMAQAEEAKNKQIAALEAQRAEIEERIKNAK